MRGGDRFGGGGFTRWRGVQRGRRLHRRRMTATQAQQSGGARDQAPPRRTKREVRPAAYHINEPTLLQVICRPGVGSLQPLHGACTIMHWVRTDPSRLYAVKVQFCAPIRSITRKPKLCDWAILSTTVPTAGTSVDGNGSGSAASRLSPPCPATNVDGWPLLKLMPWKSCTWPCTARPTPGG